MKIKKNLTVNIPVQTDMEQTNVPPPIKTALAMDASALKADE